MCFVPGRRHTDIYAWLGADPQNSGPLDVSDHVQIRFLAVSFSVSKYNSHDLFNPLDAGRRYTGISQPLKRRQTPVYRVCANFSTSPDPGISGLRKHTSLARPRYTGIIF